MDATAPAAVDSDQSPSIAALAAALAKAQGLMRSAKKDSANPFFNSKYADLASILDACREALSSNGLAVVQRVSNCATGIRVKTMLMHASGEWMSDACEWPVAKKDAQGMGSAMTYGRRYGLSAMVCIAADEDDDGNAASETANSKAAAQSAKSRTEAAKDKLRTAAPAQTPTAAADESVQAMLQLSILGKELKLSDDKLRSYIKGATGKTRPSELNMGDVDKVKNALDAVFRGESAPPH